jgi:putative ABC transport system ATP-binding protein
MTDSPAEALRLVAVHRRYAPEAPPALDGVDLVVARGEMVALMGPSGCGKSTLLHLAGLIDAPDAGSVFVEGSRTEALGDDARTLLRRERIGFVSQFFNLLPTLTAAENVALPLVLGGRRGADVQQAVAATLEAVGLGALGDRYPHQLSGGQMQRVAIGRAIVHRPALLLADEPTGSLDSATGEAVLAIFRELNAREGQTIVLATHAPEAAAGCSRLVRLRDGRVVSDEQVAR